MLELRSVLFPLDPVSHPPTNVMFITSYHNILLNFSKLKFLGHPCQRDGPYNRYVSLCNLKWVTFLSNILSQPNPNHNRNNLDGPKIDSLSILVMQYKIIVYISCSLSHSTGVKVRIDSVNSSVTGVVYLKKSQNCVKAAIAFVCTTC